jgi:hypothetical protein
MIINDPSGKQFIKFQDDGESVSVNIDGVDYPIVVSTSIGGFGATDYEYRLNYHNETYSAGHSPHDGSGVDDPGSEDSWIFVNKGDTIVINGQIVLKRAGINVFMLFSAIDAKQIGRFCLACLLTSRGQLIYR